VLAHAYPTRCCRSLPGDSAEPRGNGGPRRIPNISYTWDEELHAAGEFSFSAYQISGDPRYLTLATTIPGGRHVFQSALRRTKMFCPASMQQPCECAQLRRLRRTWSRQREASCAPRRNGFGLWSDTQSFATGDGVRTNVSRAGAAEHGRELDTRTPVLRRLAARMDTSRYALFDPCHGATVATATAWEKVLYNTSSARGR